MWRLAELYVEAGYVCGGWLSCMSSQGDVLVYVICHHKGMYWYMLFVITRGCTGICYLSSQGVVLVYVITRGGGCHHCTVYVICHHKSQGIVG